MRKAGIQDPPLDLRVPIVIRIKKPYGEREQAAEVLQEEPVDVRVVQRVLVAPEDLEDGGRRWDPRPRVVYEPGEGGAVGREGGGGVEREEVRRGREIRVGEDGEVGAGGEEGSGSGVEGQSRGEIRLRGRGDAEPGGNAVAEEEA